MQVSEIGQVQTMNEQWLKANGQDGQPPWMPPKDGANPPKPLLDMIPESQRAEVKAKLDSLTGDQKAELKQKLDENRSKVKDMSPEEMSSSFIKILNEVVSGKSDSNTDTSTTATQTSNAKWDTYV
jgi:hypothetical protein